jgi:hypothetical protein
MMHGVCQSKENRVSFSQQGGLNSPNESAEQSVVSMSLSNPGVVNVTFPVMKLKVILPASTYSLPRCGRSTLNASPWAGCGRRDRQENYSKGSY